MLIGLPPKDLLEEVALAVSHLGKDSEVFYRKNLSVTKEWIYVMSSAVRTHLEYEQI